LDPEEREQMLVGLQKLKRQIGVKRAQEPAERATSAAGGKQKLAKHAAPSPDEDAGPLQERNSAFCLIELKIL
jgi:hypothetical protein